MEEKELLSISEFAKRCGLSIQTILNRIWCDELDVEYDVINRGKMNGYVLKVPKGYDYDSVRKYNKQQKQ